MSQFTLSIEGQKPITGDLQLDIPTLGNLFRIIWDDENPDFNNKSRTADPGWSSLRVTPAVYRYYPVMKDSAGDFRVNISEWKNFFLYLNGGSTDMEEALHKFVWWTGTATAQFNQTGWPMFAYISMSSNLLKGERIGDWLQFETLKPIDLQKATGMTRQTHPHLIHTFTCVTYRDGQTVRIPNTASNRGVVDYPVITKEGYSYIPYKYVRSI